MYERKCVILRGPVNQNYCPFLVAPAADDLIFALGQLRGRAKNINSFQLHPDYTEFLFSKLDISFLKSDL